MTRVHNFNPGPCTLPLSALETAQKEFLDYQGTGMSILETSHRTPEYDAVHKKAQSLLRELLGIPEDYHILFLGGGASTQFAMIPMNFIAAGGSADYVITGSWAKKAHKEATIIANGRVAASSESDTFSYIPANDQLDVSDDAAYVHITTNNTISGSQFQYTPDVGKKPLVADMSSDILSRSIDVSQYSLIYAGAQKNLGPAGVTVIILRHDFAETANSGLPTMLSYATHIQKDSLFNTPPVFAIYMMKLDLEWIKAEGGLSAIEKRNDRKAEHLYQTIDASEGFFRCPVRKDSQSKMNVVMRLPSEELEAKFIKEAKSKGLVGLKGHRSVGGIRVSMYNAMPLESVEALTTFMSTFRSQHA